MAEDERELTHRTQHTRPLSSLAQGTLHRKKRFTSFPSPAGMSLPNSPWAGIMTSYLNYSCPGRVWYSYIPAGEGNFFLWCICHDTELYKWQQCCYITVDFATAASQNGSSTYLLSFHKKILIRKLNKTYNFCTFIFMLEQPWNIIKTVYDTLLRYANTVL
jgi:hypothetical protein